MTSRFCKKNWIDSIRAVQSKEPPPQGAALIIGIQEFGITPTHSISPDHSSREAEAVSIEDGDPDPEGLPVGKEGREGFPRPF